MNINSTLHQKVYTGLRYNSAAKIFEAVFTVVFAVIMARLLDPSVFGILAMSSIFTGISTIFINFGTGDAIIRHDEDKTTNEFLSSIFWFNSLISICVVFILILLSQPIANFFGHQIIRLIIIFFSLNIIFAAMAIVPNSILRKRLDFKSLLYQRIIIIPVSGIIGIIFVLNGYGIWSLVIQQIIATVGSSILLIYFSGWIPSLTFKSNHIKEIFHFSSYLSLSKFVNYFTKKGDLFLIGKFLGDYQLGIYSKGYQFTIRILKMINGIIIGVLYPSISKIKNDKNKLRSLYIKINNILVIIYFPFVAGIFLLSRAFVLSILGDKWVATIPLLQIFSISMFFLAVGSIASHYFMVLGKANILFKITFLSSIIAIVFFIVGLRWGIIGVALGYCFYSILHFILLSYLIMKELNLIWYEILSGLKKAVIATSSMIICIHATLLIIDMYLGQQHLLHLLLGTLVGIISYFIVLWLIKAEELYFLKEMITLNRSRLV